MFHTDLGLSKRKGSNVDRKLMESVFSHLQFQVVMCTGNSNEERLFSSPVLDSSVNLKLMESVFLHL
jgi:hypothetical protein